MSDSASGYNLSHCDFGNYEKDSNETADFSYIRVDRLHRYPNT